MVPGRASAGDPSLLLSRQSSSVCFSQPRGVGAQGGCSRGTSAIPTAWLMAPFHFGRLNHPLSWMFLMGKSHGSPFPVCRCHGAARPVPGTGMLALAMPSCPTAPALPDGLREDSASSAQRPRALNMTFAPDEIALIMGTPGPHMCLVPGQAGAGGALHPEWGWGPFPVTHIVLLWY